MDNNNLTCKENNVHYTAWKVSKYRVISGPYFPVFSPNTGKYEPEITPYLDTFHDVLFIIHWYVW